MFAAAPFKQDHPANPDRSMRPHSTGDQSRSKRGIGKAPRHEGKHLEGDTLGRTGSHGRLSGARGTRGRSAVPGRARAPALQHRRPARQGRGRKPRTGAGRAFGDGTGAASQADHDQPLPRRPAQGGIAL